MSEQEYPYARGYATTLIEFMEKGNSFSNFSGEIKVPMRFIQKWLIHEQSFIDAYEIAQAKHRTFWQKIDMASRIKGSRSKKSSSKE